MHGLELWNIYPWYEV